MSDKPELLPCPFCGSTARLESNRDWHRIVIDHDERCIFLEPEVCMVPATDDQLQIAVADWNRRAQQPAPAAPAPAPQDPVKLAFPTMLRKMWSGGEVQDWLDRQGPLYAAPPAAEQPTWECKACRIEQPTPRPCDVCGGATQATEQPACPECGGNGAGGAHEDDCSRATEQPDTVRVPRELLERLAGSPALDPDCCIAYYRNQLRALLAGGAE